ncbi:hydantoinase B/oxoprolinase family protein [Candidatus Bipolaricaulota bacterium]|nr:hydantoinase B/oxoprolinase family protein [Candidatus Bipolaricaulota bacterium]
MRQDVDEQHVDPITLEVIRHALAAAAEEMNVNLVRTAYGPNIKERRDCSCALFDAGGELVAQAESIPVHLGAMPYSVAAVRKKIECFGDGDVAVVNDPFAGGAHLPDVTFVAPVFFGERLLGYASSRAHHSDIGGKSPGSVAGDATEIFQEGLRIPPILLWKRGVIREDLLDLILANVRTPEERRGDLQAQYAACVTGVRRMVALAQRHGAEVLTGAMQAIQDYSERRMREQIRRIPDGEAYFEDVLDDDGRGHRDIRIAVRVAVRGDGVCVDFRGSSPQVDGPINAVEAVTASAVYYVLRAITDPSIPPNGGCYRMLTIKAPRGSIVHALPPAAVVGGNLETSQRIVDCLFGAIHRLCPERSMAACQGTMNNVTIGGADPRSGKPYALYETIAGGMGGRPRSDGIDGIHTHMTNTLNTPVEALEIAYPLRVVRYELIADSGGDGMYRGGMGVRRDLMPTAHTAHASLLTDRRTHAPYGISGGQDGAPGENLLINGNTQATPLPGKVVLELRDGDVLSIRTPGGGGLGPIGMRDPMARERDRIEGRVTAKRVGVGEISLQTNEDGERSVR